MKLAENHKPEKKPSNSFYESFKEDLDSVIYATTPDLSIDKEVDTDFFSNTYIPLFAKTRLDFTSLPLPHNCKLPNDLINKLGKHERDILSFIYNGKDAHRIVIIGKKGWGKTTLLRFFVAYVIPKLNSIDINKKCESLYISFNTKQNLTEKEFDKILLDQTRKFCEKQINESIEIEHGFYKMLLEKSEFSEEKLAYNNINEQLEKSMLTSSEAQKQFLLLKQKILREKNKSVVFTALEYYNYKNKIPLIVLDDLDPLPSSIQTHAYRVMYNFAHDYGVKVILSMRPRSYDCIIEDVLDTIPIRTKIILSKPNFEKYLLSKIDGLKKRHKNRGVVLNKTNTRFSIHDAENFFSYYIDVLTQKDAMSFFVNLSNGDLRTFNKLLETFLSSGYIQDNDVAKQIAQLARLKRDNFEGIKKLKKEANLFPIWVVYASIITNNYQTVFGSRHYDPSSHLINILCNGRSEINTHLIRLHLLTYFLRQKTTPTTINEIYKRYSSLINSQNKWDKEDLKKSIRRVVGRFAKATLIANNDRLFLGKMEIRRKDEYDEYNFYLEGELGKFYFENLLSTYEYFLYMKDDVELEDNEFDIKDCIDIKHRYERIGEVLKYLKFLFSKEKKFTKELNLNQLDLYYRNYAPISQEILYSNLFTKRIINYVDSRIAILDRNDIPRSEDTEKDLCKLKAIKLSLETLLRNITDYINTELESQMQLSDKTKDIG